MNTSKVGLALAVSTMTALPLLAAQTASAGQAPFVPAHRHFLITPNGQVPVGPQVCGKPRLQTAFNQFHAAVHVGPANTAFDHTHNPVDITSARC